MLSCMSHYACQDIYHRGVVRGIGLALVFRVPFLGGVRLFSCFGAYLGKLADKWMYLMSIVLVGCLGSLVQSMTSFRWVLGLCGCN